MTDVEGNRGERYLFFKDINPENELQSRFLTKLCHTPSGRLVDNPYTPIEVVDNVVRSSMISVKHYPSIRKFHRFLPVETLALPKGVKKTCEVCPKRAYLSCKYCQVTYYCSVEHSDLDSLHDKLCERIKIIRWPAPFKLTSIDRSRVIGQKLLIKERLLDELITQGYSYLSKNQYQSAMSSLFQCLKYVLEVYEIEQSMSPLITVHTGIGQAQLGLKDLAGAARSISNARMFINKAEDLNRVEGLSLYRSQLDRTEGLYYYSQHSYNNAIFHFANAIIGVTEYFHPTHIRNALSYFNLARCFLAIGRTLDGQAMMEFSVKVLYDSLQDAFHKKVPEISILSINLSDDDPMLSPYVEMEVDQHLTQIREYIHASDRSENGLHVLACEAIFAFAQKRFHDMKENLKKVGSRLNDYKQSSLHNVCKTMRRVISRLNVDPEFKKNLMGK